MCHRLVTENMQSFLNYTMYSEKVCVDQQPLPIEDPPVSKNASFRDAKGIRQRLSPRVSAYVQPYVPHIVLLLVVGYLMPILPIQPLLEMLMVA